MACRFVRRAVLAACAASAVFAARFAPIDVLAAPAPLPAEVALALHRANVPSDALVAVVQELGVNAVGAGPPRLAWQADRPVNPASLMKLLTTFAALDLLGPAWSWTTPVWLQGSVKDGVLDGHLVIKGSGDPKLVLERLWLLLRRVQQLGVREIRGDIVLDRSDFKVPEQAAADFDGEPLRPYNVSADALLLNFKTQVFTFVPDAARGIAVIAADPALAGVRTEPSVPLVAGPCEDWRAALRADLSNPANVRFAGSLAASCGEKVWPLAYADPKSYNERALAGLWEGMGGRLVGRVRDGVAPAAPPSFTLVSPALADVVRDINKFSNNVMAQQLFLTLALTQRGSGSPELARELLRQWAGARLGSAADSLVVDNGSGLSRSR